jgi:hypothetical protein
LRVSVQSASPVPLERSASFAAGIRFSCTHTDALQQHDDEHADVRHDASCHLADTSYLVMPLASVNANTLSPAVIS